MAFKLNKEQNNTLGEMAEDLKKSKEAVEAAVSDYNEKRLALHEYIEGMRDEYQSEWDEKSENWQGGERGEAAGAWIELMGEKAGMLEDELDVDMVDPDEAVDIPNQPE